VGNTLYIPLTNVSVFEQDKVEYQEQLQTISEIEPAASNHKNKGGRPKSTPLATNSANKETFNS
jgi:hypothetical protein